MDLWNGAEITILERIREIFSCAFLDTVMPVSYTHLTLPTMEAV